MGAKDVVLVINGEKFCFDSESKTAKELEKEINDEMKANFVIAPIVATLDLKAHVEYDEALRVS